MPSAKELRFAQQEFSFPAGVWQWHARIETNGYTTIYVPIGRAPGSKDEVWLCEMMNIVGMTAEEEVRVIGVVLIKPVVTVVSAKKSEKAGVDELRTDKLHALAGRFRRERLG